MSSVLSHASGSSENSAAHLRRRLQVVLFALELEALRIVDESARLHAQERVVGDGVFAMGVVAVVGGEQGGAELPGDADECGVGPRLLGEAVVLELHEEAVAAEDVLQTARRA